MAAYWRLMAWQEHQSTAELLEHATTNVTYNELFTRPDQWRGKLVQLRVHLQQAALADNLPENPAGLTSLYEVWGWNTESQPYTYWFVVPRLPPGMPSGQRILEEATFVGYFLKLLKYEDRQGVTRATPLLVGRLIWHPTPSGRLARRTSGSGFGISPASFSCGSSRGGPWRCWGQAGAAGTARAAG